MNRDRLIAFGAMVIAIVALVHSLSVRSHVTSLQPTMSTETVTTDAGTQRVVMAATQPGTLVPTPPRDGGPFELQAMAGVMGWPPVPEAGGGGGGWLTAMDCTLSAQPPQVIATDGTYSLCGFNGQALNMGNTVGGTGWSVTGAGLNTSSTKPAWGVGLDAAFYWPAPEVVPGFSLVMPLRTWVCYLWGGGGNQDGPAGIVWNNGGAIDSGASPLWSSTFGEVNEGAGVFANGCQNAGGAGPCGSGVGAIVTFPTTTACSLETWPDGIFGGPTSLSITASTPPTPSEPSWQTFGTSATVNGNFNTGSYQFWQAVAPSWYGSSAETQLGVIMGSNGGNSATFTRIVVQYQTLPTP